MQLAKYHIRKTPTLNEDPHSPHYAPHGVRRNLRDFDQSRNLVGQPKAGVTVSPNLPV